MDKRIAVVTGANRGIGFEVTKELAQKGLKVILTARKESKGKRAAQELRDKGLDVVFHQLDVTEEDSIQQLASYLENELDRLDVLVNNAGISIDGDKTTVDIDMETVRKTMETNFYGPFRVSQTLLPLLLKSEDGRIINVSSSLGALNSPFSGKTSYSISKTALNALTVNMAADLEGRVKVNSMCPGWVRTDLGGSHAARSVEQGADTAIWLATAPEIPNGKFLRDRKQIDW
ncbi:MAG: SDR family oxidoreductase [Archaeoglobaceae archaeon]